jgi:hypothetical protein
MILKLLLLSILSFLILPFDVFSQNFDAEVVKYDRVCEVTTGKLVTTNYITIQINNRFGDSYAEISLPYSKINKLSDVDAYIEDMNGKRIRDLKKSDITDKSAISNISLYEDDFSKDFELKHNVYPYKVIYTYKVTSKPFIEIADWSPAAFRLIPTRSAHLKVTLPKNYPYNRFEKNLVEPCRIDSSATNINLQWSGSYLNPIKSEIYSQYKNILPNVIVVPLNFDYGVEGSTKSWEAYGLWQHNLLKGLDILPDTEKDKIKSLIEGKTDKREIVRILYHYMQDQTRYINVSIGIGGLKPYPASYVAENKYGDCKALSNYMMSLLNVAGIESFYTKINAGEQPESVNKGFVCEQFNHIILGVPINKDTIWLENTDNTNPFGYIGPFIQNREALLVNSSHSKLIHIPALKKEDILNTKKLTFDIALKGTSKVTLNVTYRGEDFETFNSVHSELNNEEKDKYIRDYMPFDNYEVMNWDLKKLNRDTTLIELNATLNLNKLINPLGGEFYFSLYPCRLPRFTLPANRSLPVELPFPICSTDSLIYILPTGFDLKTVLSPIMLNTKYGNYSLTSSVSKGKISFIKKFELFSGSYSLDQYPDFYSFIQTIKDIDQKKIIIKPLI